METMETISLKLHTLEKRQEKQEMINNEIFMKLDTKVSYKQYRAEMGILLVILMAILGFIAVETEGIRNDEIQVKNQVSYINGVFKNLNLKIE